MSVGRARTDRTRSPQVWTSARAFVQTQTSPSYRVNLTWLPTASASLDDTPIILMKYWRRTARTVHCGS